jgi:glycine hydroxymethyltransferase
MLMCRAEHARAIDKAVFPFGQGGPMMHTIAAKAVAFGEAQTESYARYAAQVVANARTLSTSLVDAGMRAVSGGTDTHLILFDLQHLRIDGRTAEARCAAAGITLNKNAIPFDPAPPAVASGIRVGSAAVTTQGFDAEDMNAVGSLVARAVRAEAGTADGDRELAAVKDEVTTLVARKPAYPVI